MLRTSHTQRLLILPCSHPLPCHLPLLYSQRCLEPLRLVKFHRASPPACPLLQVADPLPLHCVCPYLSPLRSWIPASAATSPPTQEPLRRAVNLVNQLELIPTLACFGLLTRSARIRGIVERHFHSVTLRVPLQYLPATIPDPILY